MGYFNIPLPSIGKTFRQKINKDILEHNDIMEEIDLTDICRLFHPTAADYTFLSVAHRTFSKTDHILGHKANLNKYKIVEIIPSNLMNNNEIKLEINGKENHKNF
jgi:exonuclease III